MSGPPLVVVRGTPEEMGAQLGQRTRDRVLDSLDHYDRRFRDEAGLTGDQVLAAGRDLVEVVTGFDAEAVATLAGLADAVGVPLERIVALNARTELLYGHHRPRPDDGGCTSLAVLGSHTRTGRLMIAQNWDWHPHQRATCFLLATEDDHQNRALTLTEPGMLAKSGLSSRGMAVCANLLVSGRDGGLAGVPYHFLLRAALHAPRMSLAIARVLQAPRVSSGNLLLAGVDRHEPGSAEAIDLEVAPAYHRALLPTDGLVVHANHFEGTPPFVDERPGRSALTLLRPARVRHRLADALHRRDVTDADVVAALRDHYSHPDGVCRHPDPDVAGALQAMTCVALVMDPERGELLAAIGPSCETGFDRWTLDSVFRPDPTPESCHEPHPRRSEP